MNGRATSANLLWGVTSFPAWRRFRQALADPPGTQKAILERYLRENRNTVVGRLYRFDHLLGASDVVAAYQDAVPISTYDDLEPLVGRIATGESNVLTRAAVSRLAPSSGSTRAAKLIPHTASLQREFSLAIDAWIADLFRRHRSLVGGPAYWSVTPAISFDAIAAARLGAAPPAVPIGFDDDSAYLGGFRQMISRALLAVPDEIRLVTDQQAFRYITLLFLVHARDLRLISVWHPSFLTRLLEALPEYFDRLIADVARGTLNPPGVLPRQVRALLAPRLDPNPPRAKELRCAGAKTVSDIWPELGVVSCWADGPAALAANHLARALPGVTVQPKGLIATEGIVTIPFAGLHPLAIRSHFFEMVDPDGQCRLPHELEHGVEYAPIITTAGGLYRYRLGDRVVVDGWIERTPSLRFVGRGDRVSDRCGEKLSDGFVTAVLARIFEASVVPRFAMLAPEPTADGIAYTLLIEPAGPLSPNLAALLERELRANPHYAWCVDLGQLRPARVVCVGPHADRVYIEACVARGQRLGDVKPVSLHADSGWERLYTGT
jgi:GH3 auxin-responsive promoter